jgi:hypothetical protein
VADGFVGFHGYGVGVGCATTGVWLLIVLTSSSLLVLVRPHDTSAKAEAPITIKSLKLNSTLFITLSTSLKNANRVPLSKRKFSALPMQKTHQNFNRCSIIFHAH